MNRGGFSSVNLFWNYTCFLIRISDKERAIKGVNPKILPVETDPAQASCCKIVTGLDTGAQENSRNNVQSHEFLEYTDKKRCIFGCYKGDKLLPRSCEDQRK